MVVTEDRPTFIYAIYNRAKNIIVNFLAFFFPFVPGRTFVLVLFLLGLTCDMNVDDGMVTPQCHY